MNKTLRKEIYKKRMLHNKFLKNKSKVNWENYRKQRNHVNKVATLMKKSLKTSDTFAGSFIISPFSLNVI
jgi:hypothetical protein